MRVFIVGGAVRDQLLQRTYTDKDFVVVGATPKQMIDAGFIQVGADFPVFLHPKTKEEYALARTERKSGKGYKGFEVYASPEVTIEEDLLRRDLTINAMAIEVKSLWDSTPLTGEVIDPYDGQSDIKNKILRHVSEAFSEDPLRVLRIARFYGRFYDANAEHNFEVAADTLTLIEHINQTDELQHLTAERVWQETSRALMQDTPHAYFDCLLNVGSLPLIMPALAHAWAHTDTKQLVYNALSLAGQYNLDLHLRWAALMYSFAGTDTQSDVYTLLGNQHSANSNTSHIDESLSQWSDQQKQMGNLLKVPKKISQFTQSYIQCYSYLTGYDKLGAKDIVKLINLTKADKDSTTLLELIELHQIIQSAYRQTELMHLIEAYKQVTINDIDNELTGSAIGDALNLARVQAVDKKLKKVGHK